MKNTVENSKRSKDESKADKESLREEAASPAFELPKKGNGEGKSEDRPDPFDPARFRVDTSNKPIGVKKRLLSVPVRKPGKQEYVRVHPDLCMESVMILELTEDRETYVNGGAKPRTNGEQYP